MNELPSDKVEAIFFAALKIESPDERKKFLERTCQGDIGLHSMVEKLLAVQAGAEKFFAEDGVGQIKVEELSAILDECAKPGREGQDVREQG